MGFSEENFIIFKIGGMWGEVCVCGWWGALEGLFGQGTEHTTAPVSYNHQNCK